MIGMVALTGVEFFIWFSRVTWAVLAVVYLGAAAVAIAIIRNQRRGNPSNRRPNRWALSHVRWQFWSAWRRSLVFNDVLAITSVSLSFVALAELPIGDTARFAAVPVVSAVLPYVWGFKRATGVGLAAGSIGALLGLVWLSVRVPAFGYWEQSPYLLLLNVVANISGWLGGFVGRGQIREAVCLSTFDVAVDSAPSAVGRLMRVAKAAVGRSFSAHTQLDCLRARSWIIRGVHRFIGTTRIFGESHSPVLTAVTTNRSGGTGLAIATLRHAVDWRYTSFPQSIAWRWMSEDPPSGQSANLVVDHLLNTYRYVSAKLICVRHPNKPTHIQVAIASYNETPSIIWVDARMAKLATCLHEDVKQSLSETPAEYWRLEASNHFVHHQWNGRTTLEQHSKGTIAAEEMTAFLKGKAIDDSAQVSEAVLASLQSAPTKFDRLRGQSSMFVGFLVFQILLAVLLNVVQDWLSARLAL